MQGRAAAGVRRAGRRAQPAGVGLAAADYQRSSTRRRRGPCGWRARPSTSTPRTPGAGSPRSCPTPSWWRSSATRSTGRTRTGCTSGSTGWSPRPTSSRPGERRTSASTPAGRPFWHYRRMGRYGEQLADLFTRVDRDRVLVLRYRQLVAEPAETLDRVSTFLGIETGRVGTVPPDNSRGFVQPGLKAAVLSRVVRRGRAAGAYVPTRGLARGGQAAATGALQHGGPTGGPSWPPSSGPSCSRTAPTTSPCSRRSCGSPSTTGARSRAAAPSRSGPRAEALLSRRPTSSGRAEPSARAASK